MTATDVPSESEGGAELQLRGRGSTPPKKNQICTYTSENAYTKSLWTMCIVCRHCAHTRLPGYSL